MWWLIGCLVLFGVAVVAALLIRHSLVRGPGVRAEPLGDPFELAYLAGGPGRAVQAAVAGLRARKLLGAAGNGGMVVRGKLRRASAALGPLENAVHRAVSDGARYVGPLVADSGVKPEIAAIRRSLVSSGLLVTDLGRNWYRATALLLMPVFVVGLLGWSADGGWLPWVVLELAVIALMVWFFARSAPVRTKAGSALLREAVSRNEHLDPRLEPAWSAYGASGASLGLALFGAAAFYAADPSFAAAAKVGEVPAGVPRGSEWSDMRADGGPSHSCSSCGGGHGCGGGCGGL
ncbi:TIGR04222 domain-containing membrane protein [Cryptosporangium sp. NPDC051539]|uniref:TIGR04222 domain-containing membrane protein n=1 Tax=Cryptosporangium sp. NPDC051539 TaxID=3363962 RepID=UPI003798F0D4